MDLSYELRSAMSAIAKVILEAIDNVSSACSRQLSNPPASMAAPLLAVNTNSMVHGPSAAVRELYRSASEARRQLERLSQEPFVARIILRWEDESQPTTFYFSRASAADAYDLPGDGRLITYTAPLGRLCEYEAGDLAVVRLPMGERRATILQRALVRPRRDGATWDAVDNDIGAETWNLAVASLRGVLEVAGEPGLGAVPDIVSDLLKSEADRALIYERGRRAVVDRMALRDQPVLDKYQGEAFRMPLDKQLILMGPPGTGKTTTLIRRLAQKRSAESLSEDEHDLLQKRGMSAAFLGNPSWAMFCPTELLKLYLRNAFNREDVPAADENLRTWDRERISLARDVLSILRSTGASGYQHDDGEVFADTTSAGITQVHDAFHSFFDAWINEQYVAALEGFRTTAEPPLVSRLLNVANWVRRGANAPVDEIARLLDGAADFSAETKAMDDAVTEAVHAMANRAFRSHPTLLNEIIQSFPVIYGAEKDEDDAEQEDEDQPKAGSGRSRHVDDRAAALQLLLTALRAKARATALESSAVRGQSGRTLAVLGTRLPPRDDLDDLGRRILARNYLRTLLQAPRLFVTSAPRAYVQFRRQAAREGRWYLDIAADPTRARRLTSSELDILILVMLRNARRLLTSPSARQSLITPTAHEWLERIKGQYLMQVFVDEATDFSAVQLASMIELSHPSLRAWFAGGDVLQRVTHSGIRSEAELQELEQLTGATIEKRHIDVGYRQSKPLTDLVQALSGLHGRAAVAISPPAGVNEPEVPPLLLENADNLTEVGWLADRIVEVEQSIGRLPSIAVFVDGDAQIDALVSALRGQLAARNVPVVGCKEGRVVGDNREVRVFDVRHIKGLEFEAVFFVGLDGLAKSEAELFERYFYVGASRAATYLGVTCTGVLPSELEPVRGHFSNEAW